MPHSPEAAKTGPCREFQAALAMHKDAAVVPAGCNPTHGYPLAPPALLAVPEEGGVRGAHAKALPAPRLRLRLHGPQLLRIVQRPRPHGARQHQRRATASSGAATATAAAAAATAAAAAAAAGCWVVRPGWCRRRHRVCHGHLHRPPPPS